MAKKGFTLIELLIVIGILSILVVTILITLNPAEAQKKTRDTRRMKDLSTLQAIIQQWINDGNEPFCTNDGGCWSYNYGPVNSAPCDNSWIRTPDENGSAVNLCKYASTIPVDPRNGARISYVYKDISDNQIKTAGGGNNGSYFLKMSGSDYEINAYQESLSNVGNILNDGGFSWTFVEVGSNLSLL